MDLLRALLDDDTLHYLGYSYGTMLRGDPYSTSSQSGSGG